MNMMAVPFHGNSLYVVNHNGEPYVPMKPVVAGMGLAWQSQLAKLRQRFASTITEIVMVAEDGNNAIWCPCHFENLPAGYKPLIPTK